ncbi:MAG: hypothetical protein HY692_06770 [Cyanobacteria bacterium NC_groundwater_1444_Ag_S-0.65um_54_12]|nr:hypothetical protein [Cyanobacteria bacterium NC_groundwater_1444_Ag_S-0.65um_54_12]
MCLRDAIGQINGNKPPSLCTGQPSVKVPQTSGDPKGEPRSLDGDSLVTSPELQAQQIKLLLQSGPPTIDQAKAFFERELNELQRDRSAGKLSSEGYGRKVQLTTDLAFAILLGAKTNSDSDDVSSEFVDRTAALSHILLLAKDTISPEARDEYVNLLTVQSIEKFMNSVKASVDNSLVAALPQQSSDGWFARRFKKQRLQSARKKIKDTISEVEQDGNKNTTPKERDQALKNLKLLKRIEQNVSERMTTEHLDMKKGEFPLLGLRNLSRNISRTAGIEPTE